MRTLVFISVILLGLVIPINIISVNNESALSGQVVEHNSLSKKELKAYKKQQKIERDSIEHAEAIAALESGNWMFIVEKRHNWKLPIGDRKYNFLLVENNENVLYQRGVEGTARGNNRLGGVTIPFKIIKEAKYEKKENGEVSIEFKMDGSIFFGRSKLKLSGNSAYAEVELSVSQFGHIPLRGIIAPLNKDVLKIGQLYQRGK